MSCCVGVILVTLSALFHFSWSVPATKQGKYRIQSTGPRDHERRSPQQPG